MSAFFLDSSALVKRYVIETGTAWIQALAAPHILVGNESSAIGVKALAGNWPQEPAEASIPMHPFDFRVYKQQADHCPHHVGVSAQRLITPPTLLPMNVYSQLLRPKV